VELTLYRRIYEDIERKINTGEIGYLEQIPVLPELCRLYGVSEAPVRRALDELARDGLIVKRRRQGTFVIRRPLTNVTPPTARVLLMGDFDLQRSAIELCHEVFDLLAGIRDAGRAQGVRVQQVSRRGLEHLPPARPEVGYLIIGMGARDYEEGIRVADGAPAVLLNPPYTIDGPRVSTVRVDMEAGGYLGVNYLARLGHQRIAYVGDGVSEWGAPRYTGYRRALEMNGLSFDPELLRPSDGVSAASDEAALDGLLALLYPPTAVFAASDYRALHLLAHARRRGFAVPGALSLCGYDDIGEAADIAPALTTVRHPRYELGEIAVNLLRDLLSGGAATERVVRPEVIVRESCASPRGFSEITPRQSTVRVVAESRSA
jgi:DNA-binding LacI/PurR family transcriptional regulator